MTRMLFQNYTLQCTFYTHVRPVWDFSNALAYSGMILYMVLDIYTV